MSIATLIYLAGMFENISVFCVIFIIAFIIVMVIFLINYGTSYGSDETLFSLTKKYHFTTLKVLAFVVILCCIIPSRTTVYLMMGSSYLQNSSLPPKVLSIIENELDDILLNKIKAKEHNK